jgi:putative transposase
VHKEVIRLRALMPQAGCRSIAHTFNHLWEERRGMTVGKSFVANVVRESQREILEQRRLSRSRTPRPMPRNIVWGLDLTFLPDHGEKPPALLGIIDHGTRLCVALRHLERKTSISVLRLLLDAIERFGKPRALRTDNEALFTSKVFRFVLALLGIRHQRSAPFAPWQNGRIERFFGTFKRSLRELQQQPGPPLGAYSGRRRPPIPAARRPLIPTGRRPPIPA